MKSMKLYTGIDRIHRELAALGLAPDQPLRVADLTPFDQYHYHGTAAVDQAMAAMNLQPGMRVLDIGAGIGGPARYLAETAGVHVTALELQEDLSAVGEGLTRRCGLAHLVEHRCGNVLDGLPDQYDAIISLLCFLHIPDRARLFQVCRAALRRDGVLFVEDYARRRTLTPSEQSDLASKVQCPFLPSAEQYAADLHRAGFTQVALKDVTEDWTDFTRSRLATYRQNRQRHVALHGKALVDDLDDFYATVAGLFGNGALTGLKITAKAG